MPIEGSAWAVASMFMFPLVMICLAVTAWYAFSLKSRLLKMTDALEACAPHRLDQHRPDLPIGADDEIGRLARAFDDLLIHLSDTQARSDNIIEHAVDGLIMINSEGVIEIFNPACEQIFGYEASEVLGRNVKCLMTHADTLNHDSYLRNYQETGKAGILGIGREVRARKKSGEEFNIDLSLSEFELNGRVAYCGIIRDLTEIYLTRAELRNQKETMEFALESGELGLWDWDILNGRVEHSEQSARMIGYETSELKSDFAIWESLIHPDDLMRTSVELNRFISGRLDRYKMEFRMKKRDGNWIWVQSKGKIFDRDAVGVPSRVVGIHLDITERKRNEEHIASSEEKTRTILDRIVDGVIMFDQNGLIDSCNPASADIMKRSRHEIVGMNIRDLFEPAQWESFGPELEYALTDAGSHLLGKTLELDGINGLGEVFTMELALSSLEIGGQIYFSGVMRDITERKQMETMKNEFVSTVNHELRTPLTSIYGSLDLLRQLVHGKVDAKAARLIEIAHDGCSRLTSLVNDILDLEKIEAGKIEYKFEVTDLGQLVTDVVTQHEPLAQNFDVAFRIDNLQFGRMVSVDIGRFQQALANLLSNAAKFSERQSDVTIYMCETDDGFARVAVKDQGPGIPDNFRHRIFEKFAQADGSSSRKVAGTGLGLSITKSIMEAFGGRVSFESTEGQGTTFFLDLPEALEHQRAG